MWSVDVTFRQSVNLVYMYHCIIHIVRLILVHFLVLQACGGKRKREQVRRMTGAVCYTERTL